MACLRPVLILALLMALSTALVQAGDSDKDWVPVQIKEVLLVDSTPAVLLLDSPGQRYLLIFIDYFMAGSIRMGMHGPPLERPLTHDLIGIFLKRLGARITRISITGLKDNTYYALISLQVNGEVAEIDARPSDAMALAVRSQVPIFADAHLLKTLRNQPGLPLPEDERPAPGTPETSPEQRGKT